MRTGSSWTLLMVGALVGIVGLHFAGVNISPGIATFVEGIRQFLGISFSLGR
jgi:hypothetical protein